MPLKRRKRKNSRTCPQRCRIPRYLDSIPRKDMERVLRAYQELFSRNCPADIGEAFCYDDNFEETRYIMEQTGELWGT